MTLVYPAARAIDLFLWMREADLAPRRLWFVPSFAGAQAAFVLLEGVKGARPELEIMRPLVIYAKRQQYTDEINAILAG